MMHQMLDPRTQLYGAKPALLRPTGVGRRGVGAEPDSYFGAETVRSGSKINGLWPTWKDSGEKKSGGKNGLRAVRDKLQEQQQEMQDLFLEIRDKLVTPVNMVMFSFTGLRSPHAKKGFNAFVPNNALAWKTEYIEPTFGPTQYQPVKFHELQKQVEKSRNKKAYLDLATFSHDQSTAMRIFTDELKAFKAAFVKAAGGSGETREGVPATMKGSKVTFPAYPAARKGALKGPRDTLKDQAIKAQGRLTEARKLVQHRPNLMFGSTAAIDVFNGYNSIFNSVIYDAAKFRGLQKQVEDQGKVSAYQELGRLSHAWSAATRQYTAELDVFIKNMKAGGASTAPGQTTPTPQPEVGIPTEGAGDIGMEGPADGSAPNSGAAPGDPGGGGVFTQGPITAPSAASISTLNSVLKNLSEIHGQLGRTKALLGPRRSGSPAWTAFDEATVGYNGALAKYKTLKAEEQALIASGGLLPGSTGSSASSVVEAGAAATGDAETALAAAQDQQSAIDAAKARAAGEIEKWKGKLGIKGWGVGAYYMSAPMRRFGSGVGADPVSDSAARAANFKSEVEALKVQVREVRAAVAQADSLAQAEQSATPPLGGGLPAPQKGGMGTGTIIALAAAGVAALALGGGLMGRRRRK